MPESPKAPQDTSAIILTEAQLRAHKQAAISQVTGGFAHRMQNILSAIRLSAELSIGRPAIEAKRHLQEIIDTVDRGVPIVNQIAALAEDPHHSSRLIDLCHFFKSNKDALQERLTHLHNLELNTPKAFCWTHIDPKLFKQIMFHLIDNARQAMAEFGTLTISVQQVLLSDEQAGRSPLEDHREHVRVDIEDSGIGILPENRNRIFTPFFTTQNPDLHLGLGLTVVYTLIQQFNGWMELETGKGQGTKLSLYLPYFEDESALPKRTKDDKLHMADVPVTNRDDGTVTPAIAPQVKTVQAATPELRKESSAAKVKASILLVEDEALLRDVTHEFLMLDKYEVCSVADGEKALQAWEENQQGFDVLITDFLIPGMNGLELAKRLREQKPGLKVIFTSAFSRNVLASKHGLEDSEVFIAKPYKYGEIRKAIQAG